MALVILFVTYVACASALPPWKHSHSAGVLSAHLRGVSAPAAASSAPDSEEKNGSSTPASDKKNTTPFVDDRGERGHFYYSDACEDCFYKGDECGCEPATEYFACLTKHCFSSNRSRFAEKCTSLGSKCFTELDIKCRGPDTICRSKFGQLPDGGLGLTMEVDEKEAFCGPWGKCIGHLGMKVKVINAPKASAPKSAKSSPAPAPTKAAAPAGPAAGPAPSSATPVWLECGLPIVDKPDIDNEEDWSTCGAEAEGDSAQCDLSLPSEWVKAAEKGKVYCLLKDGEDGKRLTQPNWHSIFNIHDEADAVVKFKEDEKTKEADDEEKEEEKDAETEAEKDEKELEDDEKDAKKAEEDEKEAEKDVKNEESEGAEDSEAKEAKDDKKDEAKAKGEKGETKKKEDKQDEDKKDEESNKKDEESKVAEKDDTEEAHPLSEDHTAEEKHDQLQEEIDSTKLPWMVDKEERQADRKAEEAKKAKEPKEPKEKKEEEPAEEGPKNDSGLPWMEGQAAPTSPLEAITG